MLISYAQHFHFSGTLVDVEEMTSFWSESVDHVTCVRSKCNKRNCISSEQLKKVCHVIRSKRFAIDFNSGQVQQQSPDTSQVLLITNGGSDCFGYHLYRQLDKDLYVLGQPVTIPEESEEQVKRQAHTLNLKQIVLELIVGMFCCRFYVKKETGQTADGTGEVKTLLLMRHVGHSLDTLFVGDLCRSIVAEIEDNNDTYGDGCDNLNALLKRVSNSLPTDTQLVIILQGLQDVIVQQQQRWYDVIPRETPSNIVLVITCAESFVQIEENNSFHMFDVLDNEVEIAQSGQDLDKEEASRHAVDILDLVEQTFSFDLVHQLMSLFILDKIGICPDELHCCLAEHADILDSLLNCIGIYHASRFMLFTLFSSYPCYSY